MNEKILKYLLTNNLITQKQADELLKEHRESGRSIRELVAEQGLVTEEQMLDALAAVSRMPTVKLYEQQIPVEVRQLIKPDLMRTNFILPFAFDPDDSGIIYVAMNDPNTC